MTSPESIAVMGGPATVYGPRAMDAFLEFAAPDEGTG